MPKVWVCMWWSGVEQFVWSNNFSILLTLLMPSYLFVGGIFSFFRCRTTKFFFMQYDLFMQAYSYLALILIEQIDKPPIHYLYYKDMNVNMDPKSFCSWHLCCISSGSIKQCTWFSIFYLQSMLFEPVSCDFNAYEKKGFIYYPNTFIRLQ